MACNKRCSGECGQGGTARTLLMYFWLNQLGEEQTSNVRIVSIRTRSSLVDYHTSILIMSSLYHMIRVVTHRKTLYCCSMIMSSPKRHDLHNYVNAVDSYKPATKTTCPSTVMMKHMDQHKAIPLLIVCRHPLHVFIMNTMISIGHKPADLIRSKNFLHVFQCTEYRRP